MTSYLPRNDCALLSAALEQAGVEIRFEACETGGLARVGGRFTLFIPKGLSETRQCSLYADALKKIDLSHLRLQPRVRQLLGEEDWHG